jgi:hypothetical protein
VLPIQKSRWSCEFDCQFMYMSLHCSLCWYHVIYDSMHCPLYVLTRQFHLKCSRRQMWDPNIHMHRSLTICVIIVVLLLDKRPYHLCIPSCNAAYLSSVTLCFCSPFLVV